MTQFGPPLRRIGRLLDMSEQARAGSTPVVWRQTDGPRSLPSPCPSFMFGGASAQAGRALFGRLDLPPVGCFALRDAAVGPGGVIIDQCAAYFGAAIGVSEQDAADAAARLNASGLTSRLLSQPLALLTGGDDVLVDAMPLLWLLAATGFALPDLTFLVPADISDTACACLRFCGIDEERLLRCPDGQAVRAPRLIAPALLRSGARFSPVMGEATRFWTDQVRDALALPVVVAEERLFLSCEADAAAIGNWESILSNAQAAGMTIVQTSELTFFDRVARFTKASLLMGRDSALLREACLFAPSGAAVCALRGASPPALDLAGLAHALGHRLGYVFSRQNLESPSAPAVIAGDALDLAIEAVGLMV